MPIPRREQLKHECMVKETYLYMGMIRSVHTRISVTSVAILHDFTCTLVNTRDHKKRGNFIDYGGSMYPPKSEILPMSG